MQLDDLIAQTSRSRRHFRKVVAVMPAYNAEKTLEATVRELPPDCVHEIVLVDDASRDGTVAVARRLGLAVIERSETGGYGANQKTCYDEALRRGADAVVMVHPDFQYDAALTRPALDLLATGTCDVVLGNRIRNRRIALAGGMPVYKYLANRVLTLTENWVFGQNLGDFHSGFRAYTREVLETIPFEANSDDFLFDTQFLAQAACFGFSIGDLPISCRYFDESSSISFRRSLRYGILTVGVMGQFLLQRMGIGGFRIFQPRTRTLQEAPP